MVTVVELRKLAKKRKITGYSTMNKAQLCGALAEVGETFNDCTKGARKTKTGSPRKRSPKGSPKKRKTGGKKSPKRKSVPKKVKKSPPKKKAKKSPPKFPKEHLLRRSPSPLKSPKSPQKKKVKKAVFKIDITNLYNRMMPGYRLANSTKVALDEFSQEFIREIAPQLIGMDAGKVSFKGLLPPEFEKHSRVEKLNTGQRTISFNKVDQLIRNMGMKLHQDIVFFLRNVLEFILSDMLELSENETRNNKKTMITLKHLRTAVEEDTELRQMPGIQAILQ